jgi:integrase
VAGKKRANGEGSIVQRSDGRWMARLTLPGGKRKSFYGKTRQSVRQQLTTAQHNLQRGVLPVAERLTVAQWLAHWLDVAVKPPARRLNTYIGYEVRVRQDIVPVLGQHKLAHLQPSDVEQWLQGQRETGHAARTIQYAHAVLRAALEHALRQGLVFRNVAKLVEGVRVERSEVEPLEPETINAVLTAVAGDPWEAFYVVAIATGLRRGELLGLRWDDVDMESAEVRVRMQVQHGERSDLKRIKGRRIIPLAPIAIEALQRQRVAQLEQRLQLGAAWQENGLVFPSSIGTPMNPSNLWRHAAAILKRAGIPHHHLHLYRHTFASLHLAAGAELHEVSKLLGHSGVQITSDVYGHLTRQARHTAADRIERAIRGSARLG